MNDSDPFSEDRQEEVGFPASFFWALVLLYVGMGLAVLVVMLS